VQGEGAPNVYSAEFRDYFSQWGQITDAIIMEDSATGKSRGFGFVTYQEEKMVDALTVENFHELNGKKVRRLSGLAHLCAPIPAHSNPLPSSNRLEIADFNRMLARWK
jgi:RNA recognition motif-containing protein